MVQNLYLILYIWTVGKVCVDDVEHDMGSVDSYVQLWTMLDHQAVDISG